MIKDYKFNGFDFGELFECFEIPHLEFTLKDEENKPYEDFYIESGDDEGFVSSLSFEQAFGLDFSSEESKERTQKYFEEEEKDLKQLQDFIRKHAFEFHQSHFQKVPQESIDVHDKCVEFLNALIKDSKRWTYMAPLWKGLKKIKDKGTFLEMYAFLIGHMWS